MAVGMGTISTIFGNMLQRVTPKLDESHLNSIKVIDQIRMLITLIRLQKKVNVVLGIKNS